MRFYNNHMPRQFYSKFNVSKTRIMAAFYSQYPKPLTSKQVAEISGMGHHNVSRLLCMYHQHHYHYFQRLKKKAEDGSFRYKFNMLGIKTYCRYIQRLKKKYDLNLGKKAPVRMEGFAGCQVVHLRKYEDFLLDNNDLLPYISLSRAGEHDLGLKKEDLPVLTGLKKDKQEEQPLRKVENKTAKKAIKETLKEALSELAENKIKEPKADVKEPLQKPTKLSNQDIATAKRAEMEHIVKMMNSVKYNPDLYAMWENKLQEAKEWLRDHPKIIELM